MQGSLDTNVLMRFALKDVRREFERARALLAVEGARYQVADAVWIEIVYALDHHYGLDRAAICDVITSLMSIDSVSTDTAAIGAACATYCEHPKLSFVDCYLAAKADCAKAVPLFTFDQKLAAQHPSATVVPS